VTARSASSPRERLRVMISCGEPSGDLYAGALASEVLKLEPDAEISGFGSERLRSAGATLVRDFKGLSVTGLTEALRVIPRSWQNYRALVRAAEAQPPHVFVPIDFPDFNFFVARALHKRGIPIVYYISPQLWAWRRGRLNTMKRVVDRVLVIFPFEAPFYEQAGVPVTFVGHPIVVIAAESREAIAAAKRAIVIDIEELEPVFTIEEAKRRKLFIGPTRAIRSMAVATSDGVGM